MKTGRVEDYRLLTGRGRFVEDLLPEGMLHGLVVRSPHAHARIVGVDTGSARASPGVVAVYTAADLDAAGIGTLPCKVEVTSRDGSPMRAPPRPLLAGEEVRHLGEGVAFVVAASVAAARDAADLVEVDYETLSACTDVAASDECCFDWEKGDADAVEAAFSRADRIVSVEFRNNRVAVTPIEPRGALAEVDGERLTLHTPSQGVHLLRDVFAESVLGVGSDRLRVVTGDVGGSFGMKIMAYPEQGLVLFAARALGRPVRWIADRGESFLADNHARDHAARAEAALDAEGRLLALRTRIRANLGAYLSTVGPMVPTEGLARVYGHVYDVPPLHVRVEGMLTHTVPLDAYRGAGKPELVTLIERLIERAGRESGLGSVEIRRRNLIPPAAMPYTTGMGKVWDSGDFPAVLERALETSDWEGFGRRRETARARGCLAGIGLAMYLHASGGSPGERSRVLLRGDGDVEVRTGLQSSGQGHETMLAGLVAQRLGIERERVHVVEGDTERMEAGGGTGGSSSIPIGASTVARATERFLERARELAASRLEAAAADLEYGAGRFSVSGTDLAVTLTDLAPEETRGPSACAGEASFEGEVMTCPNGAYVAEVEVDPDTGRVRLSAFTCVDDLGHVLEEAIAEGQIVGGLVQAIGQALLEDVVYDPETGQVLSGSLLDYCLPRADDLPSIACHRHDVPGTTNAFGAKGAGEASTIGGCAAVMNAVADAVGDDGIEMPATPERVWRALRDRRGGSG